MHEGLHNLAITCIATSDDGQRIVTGSKDAAINVWFYHKESNIVSNSGHGTRRKLRLIGSFLCAHTNEITALALSNKLGIIVSGSNDCSAIIWDMHRLCLVKQLPGRYTSPVTSASISDESTNILTISGYTMVNIFVCLITCA